jgi:hypothetical protein
MKITSWKGFFIFSLLSLSACTPYFSLINEHQGIQVGNTFLVESPIAWSKHSDSSSEIWTIDGPFLQRLVFIFGIEDGQPLVKPSSQTEQMPVFRKDMSPLEIKELWEATMVRAGNHQITVKNMKPAQIDQLECFEFEFTFTTQDGLDYSGYIIAGVKDSKLIGIKYEGTSLYHYEKHLKEAQQIIHSVRLI